MEAYVIILTEFSTVKSNRPKKIKTTLNLFHLKRSFSYNAEKKKINNIEENEVKRK
jgi:hypothetical protein